MGEHLGADRSRIAQEGFTVIEMIIAIFVLSIAIIGVYSAFSVTVVLTGDAAARLQAAYLAQEGVELVRNLRDNNWLLIDQGQERTWLTGIYDNSTNMDPFPYEVDYTMTGDATNPMRPAAAPPGTPILPDVNSGFYRLAAEGEKNKASFYRTITITPLREDHNIIKVSVTVTWFGKANILSSSPSQSITAEATLFNWYPEVLAPPAPQAPRP